MVRRIAAVLLFLLFALPVLAADLASRYEAERKVFDARITEELRAINSAAVALFEQANQERAAGDHAAARRDFAAVAQMAPSFDHAVRREANEIEQLGDHDAAVKRQRDALALVRSPENVAALAQMLAAPEKDHQATEAEKSEGVELATEIAKNPAADRVTLLQAGAAAIRADAPELLGTISNRLEKMDANWWESHYLRAFAHAMQGDLGGGKDELRRAHVLGMPDDVYGQLMKAFDAARPLWQKVAIWSGWIFGPWAAGLALLFVAGVILSRAALRASSELPTSADGLSTRFGAKLRRTYAAVIGIASFYYYLSIPVVLLLTVAILGGIIFAFFAAGWVPVKLVVILGFVALVSIGSMLRSVITRTKDVDPGTRLDLAQHPRMRRLLDEVASRIGTRPVDNVYLTPGTDVAVMERGSLWRGKSRERCLILGAGVLERMTLRPFKAILGHEYGHLTNRDTAGGGLALSVRNSLGKSAMHIAMSGAATWYNPAWQFLNGFHRLFLRISHGASRLQEAMADRWAAFAYGSAAFETGLRHVIVRSVEFPAVASASLNEAINGGKAIRNLYEFQPSKPVSPEEIEKEVKEALDAETSPYDSHPAYAKRVAWVHALNAAGDPAASDDESEVWSLFSDRAGVEVLATEIVRENIRANQGIDIAHL